MKTPTPVGPRLDARDEEHDNTPAGWAEVSLTVSNNPDCKDAAGYLRVLHKRRPP